MSNYLTSPFLVRVWSGRVLWELSDVRAFAREAQQDIRRNHPGKSVAHIEFVRHVDWPFTVIDVKYRLVGETEVHYLRSSRFTRWIKRRAGNVPVN